MGGVGMGETCNATDSENDEFPNVCLYTTLETDKLAKGHFTSNSKPPACISIVHVCDQKSWGWLWWHFEVALPHN